MENCPSKQLRDHLQIFSKFISAAALYQMEKVLTFHSSNMIKVIELALDISVGKVCIYSHLLAYFFYFHLIIVRIN